MEKGISEKIERNKAKAELFLKNNTRAFIKTYDNDYYFCDILIVGELNLFVYNFAGKRFGTKSQINWVDISLILEYVEEKKEEE